MSTSRRLCAVLLFALIPVATTVHAQVPDSISFQGYLTKPGGIPWDTTLSMTFKLYKAGTSVWSENQEGIVVSNGLFNAVLGIGGNLDGVIFDSTMELGVTVKTEAEMTPRTTLMAVPYALGMRGIRAVWAEAELNRRSYNLIGGAENNFVEVGRVGATIGGGGGYFNSIPVPDSVLQDWGTLSGGYGNTAGGFGSSVGGGGSNKARELFSSIGGGYENTAGGSYAVVGGGGSNKARENFSNIGGGYENTAGGFYAVVGGGQLNQATGGHATVGGGDENTAGGSYAVVGGGQLNQATGESSVVAGGWGNEASAIFSTVGGGAANQATGNLSTIPGGDSNSATAGYTFAAGRKAKANHAGTFVWADSASVSGVDFPSTADNQFLIRARGGVGIGTNSPDAQLDIAGGNNWDLTTTDGDLKIGDDTHRLEVGVSLGGGGAGHSRINAVGGIARLVLGGGETDVVAVDVATGLFPWSSNTYSLGSTTNKWTAVWATNGAIQTSDARLKTAVEDSPYGLDEVLHLRPIVYRWTEGDDERKVGLIAQEVERVVPEVVKAPASESEYYGMNYAELVPILIKAIQEQQERIEQLEARLIP